MVKPHLRTRRPGARPVRVSAVVVLVLVLAVAVCSNTSSRALIGSTTTVEETTTTTAPAKIPALQPAPGFVIPDTRWASIRPVTGKVKPVPIPVKGGTSSVSGSVTGPDGAVPGATVRIERFVGLDSGFIMVTADGAGRFSSPGLLGGRYRVRAWLAPSLATIDAPTGFVAEGAGLAVKISVERHDSVTLKVASAVGALNVGVPAGVVALITQQAVDGNGIVQDTPLPGVSLQLVGSGGLAIDQPNPATSDGAGRVTWRVTCPAAGTYSVSVSSAAPPAGAAITLPSCSDAPPPTTPSSTTTTTIDPTTPTTKANGNRR